MCRQRHDLVFFRVLVNLTKAKHIHHCLQALVNSILLKSGGDRRKMSPAEKGVLKDMESLESRRQQLYLQLLDKRGQKVVTERDEDGSEVEAVIVSYPEVPVRLPNTLKAKPVDEWTREETIWMNV